jgi:hypothetical protein
MNKFLTAVVIVAGFVILYGVGRMWNLKPETKYNRTLHRGDTAVLTVQKGNEVWLARKGEDSYLVQVAMGKDDIEWLKGAAVPVPAGTMVKVLHETESRRQVEVTVGPQAGVKGWVEQEFLRPPGPGEGQ